MLFLFFSTIIVFMKILYYFLTKNAIFYVYNLLMLTKIVENVDKYTILEKFITYN